MEQAELHGRITDASDDDPELHAAYLTGSVNNIEYYLVVAEKTHDGNAMLKIRYFALHPDNPNKDTWMKNGVTARKGPELIEKFAADFTAITKGVTGNDGAFLVKNLMEQE